MAHEDELPTIFEQIKAHIVTMALEGYRTMGMFADDSKPYTIFLGKHAWQQLEREGHALARHPVGYMLPNGWSILQHTGTSKRSIGIYGYPDGEAPYRGKYMEIEMVLKPRPQSPTYKDRLARKVMRKIRKQGLPK